MTYPVDYDTKKHVACSLCGSSDGAYTYDDGTFCHVCQTKTFKDEEDEDIMQPISEVKALPPITGSVAAIP